MEPITLYRIFNPNSGHQYFETYEHAVDMMRAVGKLEKDEILSIDRVQSRGDIRQSIIEVFIGTSNFWWKTEILSYWMNGEVYDGKSSGEGTST